MVVRIASWNLEQGLSPGLEKSEHETPKTIVDRIEELDADVVVLPEAHRGEIAPGVDERFRDLGYDWQDVDYKDKVGVYGVPVHMRVMSRLAIQASEEVRWADLRSMLAVTVVDPETEKELEIVGMQLSDLSSRYRLAQVEEAADFFKRDDRDRVAIGGWNEMSRHDPRAVLLGSRAARFAARYIPSSFELDEDVRREDLRGLVMRTTDMARGLALTRIEQLTDLRELDHGHKATAAPNIRSKAWLPSVPLIQIDHAYGSPGVTSDGITVGPNRGSYHRDISTTIRLAA